MLVATVLLALAPASDPPAPIWQGVWKGSVGTLPVQACLAADGLGSGFGAYFYLSRLRPIRLDQAGGSRVWSEAAVGAKGKPPIWTFDAVAADRLGGTWSDGRRRLPFRLTRVARGDDPCASAAFHAPRLRPVRVKRTPARIDGVGYDRLTFDVGPAFQDVALASFSLTGGDAATRRINAALMKALPARAIGSDWYECVTNAVSSPSGGGDYDATLAPAMLTPRWLAATLSVGYFCGGAHPDSAYTSLTFDRRDGSKVDLHDWLVPAAIERGAYGVSIRPALRSAILRRAGPFESECREPLDTADSWDIGLSRRGLVFMPQLPHVVAACADSVTLSWRDLRPWLNPRGQAGAATFASR